MRASVIRPGAGKPPRHIEDRHQRALLDWARLEARRIPELAYLVHVPNGGWRSKLEAARMKRAGVRAGYPDLLLDVARGGYHGLRIEMKAPKSELGHAPRTSPEQSRWIEWLGGQGYRAVVCEGWEDARDELLRYFACEVPHGKH